MIRRILALLIVFSIILGSFSFVGARTRGHENEDAIRKLEELNVISGYSNGSYDPDEEITRAELAVIMTRINGLEQIAKLEKGKSTGFNDVPSSSPYSGYVRVASIMEIALGEESNEFGLENSVLLQEVVAMVVRSLGYDKEGQRFGPYPVGDKIMANKYKLIEGLSNVDYEIPATRAQVAQIVSNALEVPMMVMNSQGEWVQSDIYLTDEMALDHLEKADTSLSLLTLNTLLY